MLRAASENERHCGCCGQYFDPRGFTQHVARCNEVRQPDERLHMITHLPRWIRLFGQLWVFDTSRWEEWHKEAVKHPYQRTTRRRECFLSEMSERVEYLKRLREALQHIEQPQHANEDESADADADVSARLHGAGVRFDCLLTFRSAAAFSGRVTTIQSAELQQQLRTQLTKYLGMRLGHGQNEVAARHDSRIRYALAAILLYNSAQVGVYSQITAPN